ncbi:MAG: YebC/PmpR family DNA-binding transcriptional regulator [Candidatus Paceibacterota bacterium]
MSGHNKFSKIKHKKAANDAAKSKVYGKYVRLITAEAKKANGNLSSPGLQAAIERARKENMPNDTIDRAVKKAFEAGNIAMENITYEAYGPGGCALIIEALTENKNKAAAEIRHILSDHGTSLASVGSAVWAFKRVGQAWEPTTMTEISDEDGNKLGELINALEENDEVQEVFTNAE